MKSLVLVALCALMVCVGCADTATKDAREARTQQDVIDAWNVVCTASNFDAIERTDDLDVLKPIDKYFGSAWAINKGTLADDMGFELDASAPLDPEIDETLGEYTLNPCWY